jgi:integrase
MAKTPTPFEYRGRWRAQVTLKNGSRPHQDFDKHADAKDWIHNQLAKRDSENEPELGGPKAVTLAQALLHYAAMYTIVKGGRDAEMDRINHYLTAAGMRPQRFVKVDEKVVMEEKPNKALPSAFKSHRDARLAMRVETYKMIGMLANRRVSTLTTADFRKFMVCMITEALSDSSIQKEIALLKHMFNMAALEWNWQNFKNPCEGLKLKGSNVRFVVMTTEQQHALRAALAECDNPYFWPMVEIVTETTLRKGSLMSMSKENVDLEGRMARLWGKGRWVNIPLSLKTVEILKGLPPHPSGKYFPMSSNAVDMAWDGVRKKIGMPKLQFRDLRHVGATAYARAGMNSQQLAIQLGHSSTRMAEVYCNLVGLDSLNVLDRIAQTQTVFVMPPPADGTAEQVMGRNKAQRLANSVLEKAKQAEAQALVTGKLASAPGGAAPEKAPQGNGATTPLDATAIFLRSVETQEQSLPQASTPVVGTQTGTAQQPEPSSGPHKDAHELMATGTHGSGNQREPLNDGSTMTTASNVIRVSFSRK